MLVFFHFQDRFMPILLVLEHPPQIPANKLFQVLYNTFFFQFCWFSKKNYGIFWGYLGPNYFKVN